MKSKNPLPNTQETWLAEIALAYCDALEAVPFGPSAGADIQPNNLFHLAPAVCLKFRGLEKRRGARRKATDAALTSYVATEGEAVEALQQPHLAFAFSYMAAHFGLELVGAEEINEIMGYVEANEARLVELIGAGVDGEER